MHCTQNLRQQQVSAFLPIKLHEGNPMEVMQMQLQRKAINNGTYAHDSGKEVNDWTKNYIRAR